MSVELDEFTRKRIIEENIKTWLSKKGLPSNIPCIVAAMHDLGYVRTEIVLYKMELSKCR